MFKISSFEKELAQSMESNIIKNQSIEKTASEKIILASQLLHKSAVSLDKNGFKSEAAELLSVVKELIVELGDK